MKNITSNNYIQSFIDSEASAEKWWYEQKRYASVP